MKIVMTYSTMMILCATMASAQAPAPAETGYTATVRNSWNSVKRYGRRPKNARRAAVSSRHLGSGFGELVDHLASEHYLLCALREANPMAVDEKTTARPTS